MQRAQVIRIAREFAHNAEESGGRSMIIMGAGICQWFHGDATYRAVLAMLILTGSMGRNGGGWAHYVGQEKCRPITGWATMAMATGLGAAAAADDRHRLLVRAHRPVALRRLPRGRTDHPARPGQVRRMHTMDVLASSVAMGWMPFFPQFDRNSLDLADEARAAGARRRRIRCRTTGPGRAEARRHRSGRSGELAAGADRVAGQPARLVQQGRRVLPQAPARAPTNLRAEPPTDGLRPRDVACDGDIPEGKLDLMLSIDFRMTSTTLLSDLVLPAATWYEK